MAFVDNWRPRIDGVDDADASAVNEIAAAVISNEEEISKSNQIFANALKGTATGASVGLRDISPTARRLDVNVTTKNLITFPYVHGGVGATREKNGITFTVREDRGIEIKGTATGEAFFDLMFSNEFGETFSYYLTGTNGEYAGSKYVYYGGTIDNGVVSLYIQKGMVVDEVVYPQVEKGTVSTAYAPHLEDASAVKLLAQGESGDPVEYAVNADGSVDGVAPIYPTTTLTTDVGGAIISVIYNRDINEAFEELYRGNEWFLIGDVTLTEEVGLISFDTDIGCKRVMAHLTVPGDINLNSTSIVFNCENTSRWSVYANNIYADKVKKYLMECEVVPNWGVKYSQYCNGSNNFHQDLESGALFNANADITEIKHFQVASDFATSTFPVGVRLEVWGLKK